MTERAEANPSRSVHRELVALIALCATVTGAFLLTRTAAAANRAQRARDAQYWYDKAERGLAGSSTAAAVGALRRAAALDRDNRKVRLALASALAADHHEDAAAGVLMGLRASAPEDAEVNTELARLEARRGARDSAVRYYRAATYGVWAGDGDEDAARRRVRLELIHYFLDHGEPARALAELLVLGGNLPDDPAAQREAGTLFLAAGDPRRALDHFARVLRADPQDAGSLAGAGEAAFEAGEYATAQRYLGEVPRPSMHVQEIRTITHLVIEQDPLRAGLSLDERQARLSRAFDGVSALIARCRGDRSGGTADAGAIAAWQARLDDLKPDLASHVLRRDPGSVETGLKTLASITREAAAVCGTPSPADRALLLIGRRHGLDER